MPCTPGMRGCHRACLHRQLVEEYRVARIADELKRENDTHGFKTEMEEYRELITFAAYLRGMRKDAEEKY